MSKTEQAVLAAKTPEEYISASLKAKITPAAKAKLAKLWMEATGYTKEDILAARNRHPYWKKKKMEGSTERTKRRLSRHDYSAGGVVDWNREKVEEFLELNARDASGYYQKKDWELAEHFGASIPSIQYMRRKYSRVMSILGPRATKSRIADYLLRAESVLSRGASAVEELIKAEKQREAGESAAAPKKPAAKQKKAEPAPKAKVATRKKAAVAAAAPKAAKTAEKKASAKPPAKAKAAAKNAAKPAAKKAGQKK